MTEEEIRAQHPTGIKGIFYFYNRRRLWKSVPFKIGLLSGVASIIFFGALEFQSYRLIEKVFSLGLALFPNILGFSLGGYALIIGFSTAQSLKEYTRIAPAEKGSFFQLLLAIFAISLFVNLFCVLFFYFGSFLLTTEFTSKAVQLGIGKIPIRIINYIIVGFSIFISAWGLLTIPYVITNLFNLGQSTHLKGTIDRILEENQESE